MKYLQMEDYGTSIVKKQLFKNLYKLEVLKDYLSPQKCYTKINWFFKLDLA